MRERLAAIIDREGFATLSRLFLPVDGDDKHQVRGKRILRFLLPVLAVSLGAGLLAFFEGHHVLGTTSEIPWGVLIATYVFFVVSSTGLCLVSSLGHVFGFEVFQPLAKKATFLALVILVIGFAVIGTELERPLLLVQMAIFSPNPTSPIWWMGALYGLYMVFISAELYLLFIEDHRRARVVGSIKLIVAVAASSNLGAVFGLSHARPVWYGAFFPIYFIATALVAGTALLIVMVYLEDYYSNGKRLRAENEPLMSALRQLFGLFLIIFLFFTAWRVIGGISGGHYHRFEVMTATLTGAISLSFWLFEVFVGVVVPLFIVTSRRGRDASFVALAAIFHLTGMFVVRYNFVYSGQMFSLKPKLGHFGELMRYEPPFKGNLEGFLPYTPSWVEVLVVIGAISAAILAFTIGSRILKLEQEV